MIVGIDFDNTLVDYEGLFHREAVRRGLVPSSTGRDKLSVRNALRQDGRDEDFTLLQGYVYGPGILEAPAYPGALDVVERLLAAGCSVYVISHKTRRPYRGPAYDLHEAARRWLEVRGFLAPGMLPPENVLLEPALDAKLRQIGTTGCSFFVDDLPEFLCHADFPPATERLLFDPLGHHAGEQSLRRFASWREIGAFLLGEEDGAARRS